MNIVTLNKRQLDYVKAPLNSNIYLRACPGSGKTEVIAAKVALEMKGWSRFPAGMAVLTFSRSATRELAERVAQARRGNHHNFPHFIGTVDSFILKNIVAPLAHHFTGYAGNDGDYSIRVVDERAVIRQRTRYAYAHASVPANRFDWDTATGKYVFRHPSDGMRRKLNSLGLKDYEIRDLTSTKAKFCASGFATHRDVELLALKILGDARYVERIERLAARYPVILIDECQDLSVEQIHIFAALANMGVHFHLIGDLDQAIYGFRNCSPDSIATFIGDLGCTEMPLDENHRSGQAIVDLHRRLVKGAQVTGQKDFGPKTCYLVEYESCPSEALAEFDKLSDGQVRAVVVARGHSTLARLTVATNGDSPVETLARAIFSFAHCRAESFRPALALFASYLAENCVDVDTHGEEALCRPVDVESEEIWHRFLFDCLDTFVAKGLANPALTWSQWCQGLKKVVPTFATIPSKHASIQQILKSLSDKKHSSPAQQGGNQVGFKSPESKDGRRVPRLATIHEVKGETHDVTMLVSSTKKGHESHWKDWLEDHNSEAARFAYVASSRPKHILIWVVKSLKKKERTQLMALGFQEHIICKALA
jgi:superfamily I DNA/RNA helicase